MRVEMVGIGRDDGSERLRSQLQFTQLLQAERPLDDVRHAVSYSPTTNSRSPSRNEQIRALKNNGETMTLRNDLVFPT